MIAATADIEIKDLQQRAAQRFLIEEAKKQVNMVIHLQKPCR